MQQQPRKPKVGGAGYARLAPTTGRLKGDTRVIWMMIFEECPDGRFRVGVSPLHEDWKPDYSVVYTALWAPEERGMNLRWES